MIRDRFSENLQKILSGDEWLILQDAYQSEENLKFESLFCLSNGYLGIRGSHEEGTKITLPYVYINGVFDKSETFMRELAALPNWLGMRLYMEKELIGIENGEILEYARVLDMKQALVAKRMRIRDKKGRETLVESLRFVSRLHVHRMGVKLYVTPLNYSGTIEIESITDGSIFNFYDAPRFKVKHTYLTANEKLGEDGTYLEVATRDNHLHVGTGSRISAKREGKELLNNRMFNAFGEEAVEFADVAVRENEMTEITKYVSMYTQREISPYALHVTVKEEVESFMDEGWEEELTGHRLAYEQMWNRADVRIKGDFELNRAIRFNLFHLMSTGNEKDDRVNVGAKLLSGEEYGGHAFWDTELFMLPFFSYVFPETAKNLENYRYHLLDAAKANAKKNGFRGAQYPWESADDGMEQCPDWTIEPDGTCYRCYVADYEHHVTAAVAYGIHQYVKVTNDWDFMLEKGAKILTETARFWASRCEFSKEKDRYEIKGVTGPDEWHEPVNNNLYTNYLARWNLKYVGELMESMKKQYPDAYETLAKETHMTKEEADNWAQISGKIYLPRKENTALLEQFEGYFELDNVVIDRYDENDWPIRPLALKNKRAGETQIIKQADVVMLLHLMSEEFDEETAKVNYSYYEKRTLHGSSLSPSIYAIMGLKVGDESKAYRYLKRAALIDLVDLQKNTREGIHAANTGGVWQTVVFGFAGVSAGDDQRLHITPHMPKEWEELSFCLHYMGSFVEICIKDNQKVSLRLLEGRGVQVVVNGALIDVE